MPKVCMAVAASVLIAGLPLAPAQAWFHGYSGGGFSRGGSFGGWNHSSSVGAGGFSHSSDWGGWDHSTQVTSSGVAHESDYGGAWHGTAATPDGAYHASDYGGYYHGTAVGPYGAEHTGYYGHTTTTAYGTYYHQPATVNYYGSGCYNCGYSGWGAAAAGAAVGAATGLAVGAAAGSAATAAAYAPPPAYVAALPAGCFYQAAYQEYQCGSTWYRPAYGANGVYYQYVAAP